MKLMNLVKRYPVMSFFVLTFSWSWLIWSGLFWILPGGMYVSPGVPRQLPPLFIAFFIGGGIGPSLMGIVLTRFGEGKGAVRKYLLQLRNWQIELRWYLAVLFTAPVLALGARLLQNALGRSVSALHGGPVIVSTLIMGLLAGLLEEFGWRGFVLPRLLSRYAPLISGLLVGVPWGIWHLIAAWWGVGAVYGEAFWLFFLIADISNLTAYSLLMAWVCYSKKARVQLAILFHGSMAASINIFLGDLPSVQDTIMQLLLFSVVSWITVGIIYGVCRFGVVDRVEHR